MQERLHEINSLRSDLRGQRGRLSHAPGTRCLFPVDLRSGFPEISPLPARSRGKFQPAPRRREFPYGHQTEAIDEPAVLNTWARSTGLFNLFQHEIILVQVKPSLFQSNIG